MQKNINDSIIKILGIDSLPKEEQQEAMERLGAIVYQEVMLRVLDILNEEDKDEFEKLIEKTKDPEIMFSFLMGKIPNFEEIVNEESEKLKKESAELMGNM